MQNSLKCIHCGRTIPPQSQLCFECESRVDGKGNLIDYSSDQQLIPNGPFAQRMFAFFEEFFSRPEVQSAYEEYNRTLCDELSQRPGSH